MPRALLQRSSYRTGQVLPQRSFTRPLSAASVRGHEGQDNGIDKFGQDQSDGQVRAKKKTMAEQDEELKAKLAQMSDGGGEAGVEYEGGKPVAMKQAVRNHMFRIMPFRGK